MKHNSCTASYIAVLFGLILSFNLLFAQEDPRLWEENGVSVRQGTYLEWQQQAATHEDGSTCVIWSDTRNGNRDIYAQRLRSDCSVAWTENGIAVVSQSDRQEDPVIIAVEDGWIIAWVEYVDLEDASYPDYSCSVYAQKLNLMGNPLWRIDGALVANTGTDFIHQRSLQMVPDAEGGAMILWYQNYDLLYAQRIDNNGVVAWDEPVLVAEHADYNYHYCQASTSDGLGNMIVAWKDTRDPNNYNLYAAKIMVDGTLPWGEGVNGVPICMADNKQSIPSVCSDHTNGGFYAAWVDERDSDDHNLYVQRFNADGTPLWTLDGVLLCGAEDHQEKVRIAPSFTDGTQDGIICVWEDERVNGYIKEVYAQKVNSDGILLWSENGSLVCGDATPDFQGCTRNDPLTLSDGSGGAVFHWNDTRNDDGNYLKYDIYASRFSAAGENLWGECGVPVASEEGIQEAGFMLLDEDDSQFEFFCGRIEKGSKLLNHLRISLADGSLIPDEENIVTEGFTGNARDVETIAMSNDRVGIVWEDSRGWTDGRALYYQIVDDNGNFELPVHGIKLAPDNTDHEYYDQTSPALASDGNGGIFVAFMDNRTGTDQIRLSKINSAGVVVSDSAGVVVYDYFLDQYKPLVCADGSGGCYVAWHGMDLSFTLDVYLQHFDENCAALWDEPIQLTNDGQFDDVHGALIQSEGCCIVVWETGPTRDQDIMSARVCADGEIGWTRTVCSAEDRQSDPDASEDGFGGVFIAWEDKRTEESNSDIYAQYLNVNGELMWQGNGVPVIVHTNQQFEPVTIHSTSNEFYVVWEDFRNGTNTDLYAQRIDISGNLLWDEAGLEVAIADDEQTDPALAVNNLGGFTCVWSDQRDNYSDIYAADILPDGSTSSEWWVAEYGGIVSSAYHSQEEPSVTSLGGYRLFVAWEDWRSTGFPDYDRFENEQGPLIGVYSQLIETGTTSGTVDKPDLVPSQFVLHQNYPNPFNPSTTISFAIPNAGQTSLIVYDLLGRTVETLMDKPLTAGNYHIQWNANSLPSGVYFYRLTSEKFTDVKKTILLK